MGRGTCSKRDKGTPDWLRPPEEQDSGPQAAAPPIESKRRRKDDDDESEKAPKKGIRVRSTSSGGVGLELC